MASSNREDVESRRVVFGLLRGILVRRGQVEQLTNALLSREYPGNHWIPEPPESYYVYAGEMPWSSRAREDPSAANLQQSYSGVIKVAEQEEIPVEIPVHRYSWESYHSSVNKAGPNPVPAVTFAEAFDLRTVPNSLDWCDAAGRLASRTLSAPSRFKWGHLLYLREDLIERYCKEHDFELVWIVWGERRLFSADYSTEMPEWVYEAYATNSHIWRRVATLSEVKPK